MGAFDSSLWSRVLIILPELTQCQSSMFLLSRLAVSAGAVAAIAKFLSNV